MFRESVQITLRKGCTRIHL